MANTLPFEVLAGPADLYIASYATPFPDVDKADTHAQFANWTKIGRTDGGVTVRHTQSVELLSYDQGTGPVKAIRSEEGLEIEASIMNLTLENYSKVIGGVVTVAAGSKYLPFYRGIDVDQFALLARGPSPYMDGKMQWQVPLVVQTEEPELEFTKDDKAVMTLKYSALEDPNASSQGERFGKIVAQTT